MVFLLGTCANLALCVPARHYLFCPDMAQKMPRAHEEWLSPELLGARLGIPLRTIYRWNTTGRGPRLYRVGRHVRYRWCDVAEWLEQGRQEAER
jgi:excisionase family DNA binding protein